MSQFPTPDIGRLRLALHNPAGPTAFIGVMRMDLEHALEMIDAATNPQPRLPIGDEPSQRPGADDARWTDEA